MTTQLGFSNYEGYNNMNKNTRVESLKSRQNKTCKNRGEPMSKMTNNVLEGFADNEGLEAMDVGGDDLADFSKEFSPPSPPEISKTNDIQPPNTAQTEDPPLVDQSQYNKLHSNYVKQYYQQYVPDTHTATNMQELSTENRDDILKKINYMIYLLEEQKDEKTSHVTEEVILYMFLGVFLIFVIDSFSKTHRYKR